MTRDAEQILETRLSEVIETATSTYLSALDNEERATAKLYVQKAAQAADEAWQQTVSGLVSQTQPLHLWNIPAPPATRKTAVTWTSQRPGGAVSVRRSSKRSFHDSPIGLVSEGTGERKRCFASLCSAPNSEPVFHEFQTTACQVLMFLSLVICSRRISKWLSFSSSVAVRRVRPGTTLAF